MSAQTRHTRPRRAALTLAAILIALSAAGSEVRAAEKPPAAAAAPAAAKVDLNTASLADLQTLPGVGPSLAQRILDYRKQNGGFKTIEELMNVKGIGEKSFEKIRPLVTVAPAR